MRKTDSLPFDIEDDIGEVLASERLCPGVYYVSARDLEKGLPHEYYIASKREAPLSEQAKAYGTPMDCDEDLLAFLLENEKGGGTVVRYEVQKYRATHQMPMLDDEAVLVTAIYGMEHYPEYFGGYPVPALTPRGTTLRHKRLACGVYLLETESFERTMGF